MAKDMVFLTRLLLAQKEANKLGFTATEEAFSKLIRKEINRIERETFESVA